MIRKRTFSYLNSEIPNYDTQFPIDTSLRSCSYLYRAGSQKSEAERYFFIPDDHTIFYPEFILDEELIRIFEKTKSSYTLSTLCCREDEAECDVCDICRENGQRNRYIQRKYFQLKRSDLRTYHLRLHHATFLHNLIQRSNTPDINAYCSTYCKEHIAPNMWSDDGEEMLDEDYEYFKLVVESQIVKRVGVNSHAEIRRNHNLIHTFSDEEVDRFDDFLMMQS